MNVEGWRVAPLGEVCEISTKLSLDPEPPPETEVSFVPMAAIDEIEGAIIAAETRPYSEVRRGFTSFRENDVLFAKITPCMENGKAAIARDLRNGLGFGSTEFYVLRAGPGVRPEWLFAFIRRPAFRAEAKSNFTGSAGQQRVPLEFMRRVEIPVPPLNEQDAIIRFLREGENLRFLRGGTPELIDSLRISIFDRMFGSYSDIAVRPLSELGETRYGLTVDSKRRQTGEAVPYLRVANVGRWNLDLGEVTSILANEGDIEKCQLQQGDVLVVEGHADAGAIGRAAVWNEEVSHCLHQNHILRIRPYPSEATPNFLAGYINSSKGREYMRRFAKTSSGLFTINSTVLNSMPVPAFPLVLQQEFERRHHACLTLFTNCAKSRDKIATLFESLVSRAFNSELTASWRAQQAPQEPAAIEAKAPEETPPPEPQAPPISVPQIIADRDRIYTSLSPSQRALFDRVAEEPDYFSAEEIAKEDTFDLVGVKRGLQLLAAAGFIVAASRAVNPSESEIFYVDSFRMPRPEDDVRLDLVSEYLVSE